MPPKKRCWHAKPKQPPRPSQAFEYRTPVDDAWYSVHLRLDDGRLLRVMYNEFLEADDEHFDADKLPSLEELEALRGRFRPESVPLQDKDCRGVVEGTRVCASHAFAENELRFYDAVVDSVTRDDRKDVCSCTFVVLWQHGPLATKKTSTGIKDICLIQSRGPRVDPMLEHFLDIARRKLEARNSQAGVLPESSRNGAESMRCDLVFSNTKVTTSSDSDTDLSVHYESKKAQSSACNLKEMTPESDVKCTFQGKMYLYKKGEHDLDLGSSKKRNSYHSESYFFFLIKNLEKDISPSYTTSFIYEHTSISSVAFISPALSSESYSTGTILVETKEKAVKLSEFLFNPEHIIMSSRGRPWVVSEKWHGSREGKMPIYEERLSNKKEHPRNIKLVYKGSKEYEKSERLIQIHREFHDHVELLQKRLEREERKRLQLPLTGNI